MIGPSFNDHTNFVGPFSSTFEENLGPPFLVHSGTLPSILFFLLQLWTSSFAAKALHLGALLGAASVVTSSPATTHSFPTNPFF